MAQLSDIIRAEADAWWIILFIIVGIVRLIQFITNAKKNTAKPPQTTGAEDNEKRNELEDLLSGLTQTLRGEPVFKEESPLPPSIASKMDSDETPIALTPKHRQPVPKQQPTVKYKTATRKTKKITQTCNRLPGNDKTIDIIDSSGKNKHHPANRLFPPVSLLNINANFRPSPLVKLNTRRELKRALVLREVFGPARALEPSGTNKYF